MSNYSVLKDERLLATYGSEEEAMRVAKNLASREGAKVLVVEQVAVIMPLDRPVSVEPRR